MIQMETEMIDRHHLNYHISATHKTLEEKYFYRPEVSEFGLEWCKNDYPTSAIIIPVLYTFYPLFEVYLCAVTFALMYG